MPSLRGFLEVVLASSSQYSYIRSPSLKNGYSGKGTCHSHRDDDIKVI
jgi:hypothetical protein